MLKIERSQFIMRYLEELYPETPVPLNNRNHFELLVAVLLSAQCTDKRVNEIKISYSLLSSNLFLSKILKKDFPYFDF